MAYINKLMGIANYNVAKHLGGALPRNVNRYMENTVTSESAYNITKGLVCWLKFDGDVNDDSGNGKNGTAYGSPSYTTGKVDATSTPGSSSCLTFDSNAKYVTIPALNLNSNTVTLACWVNGVANDYYTGVIFSRDGSTIAGITVHNTYAIGKGHLGWHWNGTWNTGETQSLRVPDNTWAHLAMVVESDGITMYLDGTASTKYSWTPGTEEFDDKTVVGQDILSFPSSVRWWNGKIDDVRIYNRSLSGTDIAQLAAMPQW